MFFEIRATVLINGSETGQTGPISSFGKMKILFVIVKLNLGQEPAKPLWDSKIYLIHLLASLASGYFRQNTTLNRSQLWLLCNIVMFLLFIYIS